MSVHISLSCNILLYQSTDWSNSDIFHITACSVFCCKSSAIAVCHIHPSNVSHFLAFQVLYLSVHISLPVQTAQNQTALKSLLVRLLCLQPATINQWATINQMSHNETLNRSPFVTGAMLFLLVPLLFCCCCVCQQRSTNEQLSTKWATTRDVKPVTGAMPFYSAIGMGCIWPWKHSCDGTTT